MASHIVLDSPVVLVTTLLCLLVCPAELPGFVAHSRSIRLCHVGQQSTKSLHTKFDMRYSSLTFLKKHSVAYCVCVCVLRAFGMILC